MNAKEILQDMLKGNKPERLLNGWEPFGFMLNPVTIAMSPMGPGLTVKDAWGVTMSWPEGQPGVMPMEGDLTVCPDVEEWEEKLHAPDVKNMQFDWGPFLGQQEAYRKEGKLSVTLVPVGNFELMHNLLGFENCLMNFLMEPEIMYDIAKYIADYRMECYKQICENLHPDVLFQHDDWGAKESMLMSPDVWREFFKPFYKELYDYLHEQGVIVMHHADSFLEPIIPDMVELGVDIWQGTLPQNDIVKIQSQLDELGSHMILMGGIDCAVVDKKNCPEDVVRKEVRRACEAYAPKGRFIPAITSGGPGCIHQEIDPIIFDEIQRYISEQA